MSKYDSSDTIQESSDPHDIKDELLEEEPKDEEEEGGHIAVVKKEEVKDEDVTDEKAPDEGLKQEDEMEQEEEEVEYVCNHCGLIVMFKRAVQKEEESSTTSEESAMSDVNLSDIVDDRSEEPSCGVLTDDEASDGVPDGMSSEISDGVDQDSE
jgi:hypothetical protein